MKRHGLMLALIALVSVTPLVALATKPVAAQGWERDFLEDDIESKNPNFLLAILSSIEDRLVGYFAFHNQSIGQVILNGTKTQDREFWPSVLMQVSNGENSEWTTIAQPATSDEVASLTVDGKSTAKLMIKMDSFRPFVGKFKFGRVVLENGEPAWFELNELRPPDRRKAEGISPKNRFESKK